MAEALLYLDKISESIENLNINARLESDGDISFISPVGAESTSFSEHSKSKIIIKINSHIEKVQLININFICFKIHLTIIRIKQTGFAKI